MQESWIPGAVLTLGTFGIVQLGSLIWFIAETKTLLNTIGKSVGKLEEIMREHDRNRYTDVSAAKDFAFRDQQIDALWKSVDKIKEKVFIQ